MKITSSSIAAPIIKAISEGNIEGLKLLLEYGADVEAAFSWDMFGFGDYTRGITPLMEAARLDSVLCARILLRHGANLDARDHSPRGWDAYTYANRPGRPRTKTQLLFDDIRAAGSPCP